MKKFFSIMIAVALLVGISAMQAEAFVIPTPTAEITIQVTLQVLSVEILDGGLWVIDAIVPGTSRLHTVTVQNNGNGDESLLISAGNATGAMPKDWALGISGPDSFALSAMGSPITSTPSNFATLSAGETTSLILDFTAPTSSTDNEQKTITAIVSTAPAIL